MNIKYYSLKIDGKIFQQFDNKEDAIKEYFNLDNTGKKLYEITVTNNGLNEKLISNNEPFNEIKWFEIHSTECTGKYTTLEEAKEDLKNMEDWYHSLETGSIYECSINNVDFTVNRMMLMVTLLFCNQFISVRIRILDYADVV